MLPEAEPCDESAGEGCRIFTSEGALATPPASPVFLITGPGSLAAAELLSFAICYSRARRTFCLMFSVAFWRRFSWSRFRLGMTGTSAGAPPLALSSGASLDCDAEGEIVILYSESSSSIVRSFSLWRLVFLPLPVLLAFAEPSPDSLLFRRPDLL